MGRIGWKIAFVSAGSLGLFAAAGVYWLTLSPLAGGIAATVAILQTISLSLVFARGENEAMALIRRPELRSGGSNRTSIFRGVVDQALELLECREAEAREATAAKLSLEVRSQSHRKRIQWLETSLDSLDNPVLVVDARNEIRYVNEASRQLFRGGQEDGSENYELNSLPELKTLVEETRARNAATDSRTRELELAIGDQTTAFRAKATNAYDDAGLFLGIAVVLQDIDDERLVKTRHAEFVSSVAHELKTPMASIKAFVEMLQDGDCEDAQEQMELYGFIDIQVDRLTRLVNNMLNLARIESGVIKIQREDCELNEILRHAMDVVVPVAEEKQIQVHSEISDLYMAVQVDSDLLGQAVINLLSNAVKYTPEGGEVRVRSRMDEGMATIEVRDTGMGIPADSLPHIFDRFYRVPENNKAAAGTGLGLALVHYVVTDIHNGTVEVSSTVGEGTCFTFTIPLGHRSNTRKKLEPVACAD